MRSVDPRSESSFGQWYDAVNRGLIDFSASGNRLRALDRFAFEALPHYLLV